MKKIEKGYLCTLLIFILLVCTVVYALFFVNKIADMNYRIAEMNADLITTGIYIQVNQVSVDMSLFNWIITAESTALAMVTSVQLIKKRTCNVYEYAEKWIDKWLKDPDVRPYITQIVTSWMSSNPTSMTANKQF